MDLLPWARRLFRRGHGLRADWEKLAPWAVKLRFYWHLVRLVIAKTPEDSTLLAVWSGRGDLEDGLAFVQAISVICDEHRLDRIDVCVVRSRSEESRDGSFLESVDILSLLTTCERLGSVFVLRDQEKLSRFLKSTPKRYVRYQSDHAKGAPGERNRDIVDRFMKSSGRAPVLRIGPREVGWSCEVISEAEQGTGGVVALWLPEREWADQGAFFLEFVRHCESRFPQVTFLPVASHTAKDKDWTEQRNVSFLDYTPSHVEQLALLKSALMVVGVSLPRAVAEGVGVSSLMLMGEKAGVGEQVRPPTRSGVSDTTLEELVTSFGVHYSRLNPQSWRAEVDRRAKKKHGHPSAQVSR